MTVSLRTLAMYALRILAGGLLFATLQVGAAYAQADTGSRMNGAAGLASFDRQQEKRANSDAVSDKEKREIMFFIGIPLLILIISTGAVGIAMAVYDKQVFVVHMVLAALSVTLALVHVIVGLVWFNPFW